MTRRCTCCGALVRWSDLAPIFDGGDPTSIFFGLAMANHSCGGTLAEPAGLVLAARVVERAIPHSIEVSHASV